MKSSQKRNDFSGLPPKLVEDILFNGQEQTKQHFLDPHQKSFLKTFFPITKPKFKFFQVKFEHRFAIRSLFFWTQEDLNIYKEEKSLIELV
jgi:hypothetical protein